MARSRQQPYGNSCHSTVICSLSSHDFTGAPLASRSFTATDQAFDAFLSFSITEVPYWAYVSLNCEIYSPSVLLGITAVQPEAVPGAAAVASVSDADQRARDRSAFTTHVAAIAEAFNKEARDPQWSRGAPVHRPGRCTKLAAARGLGHC